MPYLPSPLKPAERPVDPRSTVPLEARLRRAMAARNEPALVEAVQEWEAFRRPHSLMSWGIHYLDDWGMEQALRLGAVLTKKNLKAYVDRAIEASRSWCSAPKTPDPWRAWSSMWEALKDEPGFAHDALLRICSGWGLHPQQPVGVDWTDGRFAGVMAHVPEDGLLNWDSPLPEGQGRFRVSPLMLAWLGADVALCQALLMAGANPFEPCPSSSWPAWTFEKATRDVSGLMRESMREFGGSLVAAPGAQPVRMFSTDPKISTLGSIAKERRARLSSNSEAALAGLVRWVPLDRSLPAAAPAGFKPRF